MDDIGGAIKSNCSGFAVNGDITDLEIVQIALVIRCSFKDVADAGAIQLEVFGVDRTSKAAAGRIDRTFQIDIAFHVYPKLGLRPVRTNQFVNVLDRAALRSLHTDDVAVLVILEDAVLLRIVAGREAQRRVQSNLADIRLAIIGVLTHKVKVGIVKFGAIAVYTEQDRLPILADGLNDQTFTSQQLTNNCRCADAPQFTGRIIAGDEVWVDDLANGHNGGFPVITGEHNIVLCHPDLFIFEAAASVRLPQPNTGLVDTHILIFRR